MGKVKEPLFSEEQRVNTIVFVFIIVIIAMYIVSGCTISFQNISTHGTATDLVDENQRTDPTTNPNFNIPISGVPGI
jgi:flagellar basal body-associated protein FliL